MTCRERKKSMVLQGLAVRSLHRNWHHPNAEARETERMYAWFAQLAVDCRCCSQCWGSPCGGCAAGGVCDSMPCRCSASSQGFDDGYENDDETDYQDGAPW